MVQRRRHTHLIRAPHILFLLALCSGLCIHAQAPPTFYADIYPIVEGTCMRCHAEEGPAPFPLQTYEDYRDRGRFIAEVTRDRYMPPWPADPGYRHFNNELRLSDGEIATIARWVEGGMQKGKANERPAGRQPAMPLLQAPDTLLGPAGEYLAPGDGKDHFVYFLLPDTLRKDMAVNAFRFYPSNARVVHHMELLAAGPGVFPGVEGRVLTEEDYYGLGFRESFGTEFAYIAGWLPGNAGERYPDGSGRILRRGSRLILMVHYAPSPVVERDKSRLGIFYAKDSLREEVSSIDLHGEADLVDGPLYLPAGNKRSFHARKVLEEDFEAFAVFPHAHHLCTSVLAYACTPEGDTLQLLRIPAWDFDWQFTYYLDEYLRLPAGSVVHFHATYDNSSDNPENPYSPPQDVRSSFKSEDEMMEMFIWGFEGVEGDRLPLKYSPED